MFLCLPMFTKPVSERPRNKYIISIMFLYEVCLSDLTRFTYLLRQRTLLSACALRNALAQKGGKSSFWTD